MKKRQQTKTNAIFFPWKCKGFLMIFIFALCLVFIASRITSYFTDQGPDINDALQEYLKNSFSSNVNSFYLYDIERPMEEFMDSSAATSFFFCSEQYPPAEDLISYLEEHLTSLTEGNEYITAAALYASASNTYVYSSTGEMEESAPLELLSQMVYNYNSSSLDKNKIFGEKFNTFLFKYQDYIVFSKDLTTSSGSAHSTMFLLMNLDAFSSFIYGANNMIPYRVSIYDAHNSLLYSNSEENAETVYSNLLNFTADSSVESSHLGYIYCSSDVTGMQYLLEMDLIPLPSETTDPPLMYVLLFLSGVLLALFFFLLLQKLFKKSEKSLSQTMNILELKPTTPLSAADTLEKKVSALVTENQTFKEIVHATAAESVSNLFAKILDGGTVEKEEARITLDNSGYGFRLDDIYIAGILHQTVTEFITANIRHRVLNMLSSIFEKFKETKQCNLCAFLFDEKSFVIVASFPAGTSIAKGKSRINDLTRQINEGISLLNIPMSVAFGHMYNSILDLSFSYNEAFKAMHYYQANIAAASSPSIASLHNMFPATSLPVSDIHPEEQEETDHAPSPESSDEIPEPSEQIERRASQIAQLIWDEREDGLSSLISRTTAIIFNDKEPVQEQTELTKQLISAVTSHMLSYPFVNDSHLPNVLDDLPLDPDLPMEIKEENLKSALSTLCQNFSDALKKLRNPYIISAQDYIEKNYNNPDLSLEEIAENLKIAPNYLSTIFSKNLGIKLFEYINEYRLEKSIHLLLNTDMTINDISIECGFNSSRNYIRIFKKYKENTPGAYRKQHRSHS